MLTWKLLRLLSMPIRYIVVLDTSDSISRDRRLYVGRVFAPAMKDIDAIYATFGDRKLFVGYFCKQLINKPLAVDSNRRQRTLSESESQALSHRVAGLRSDRRCYGT